MEGASEFLRRSVRVGVAGVMVAALAACTGRGGGQLAPTVGFPGRAHFGFEFSCEDKGGTNPQTGQLRIQLSYADRGASPALSGPISIHGIVDQIDPVLESAICIGQNPPPGGKELIFLGRYRNTAPPPPGFPSTCTRSGTSSPPACRFEVIVRDNDGNLAPSSGDLFSVKLSSTTTITSDLPPASVFYARAGLLSSGNLTVD